MPSNTVKFTPEKPAKEKRSHGMGVTIFSAVILVVIVVTFIGAPVVSKATETPSVSFGSYDGISIDFLQGNLFSSRVEQLNRFYEQFNQGSSNVDLQRQMVWRQAFEQTALQVALEREAKRAGIVVTDAAVDKALVTHSAYLNADGKFSEEAYNATSTADRFKYRQETTSNLLVTTYATDRTQGALLSEATKAFIAGLAFPQKKFSFVTFTDADYPASLVSEYGLKNKNLFRTIDLSRITINSSEGDANNVRAEAVKGDKAFADLAKTYSKDGLAESGGALSVRHYYELNGEVTKTEDLDKIFALAKGGISAVIKEDKSWVMYKVNAPAADADLTSADVQAVVRSYIARKDRGLLEDNLEAQAKEFTAAAKTDFAAAAKKFGKTVETTSWVALNFGNHDLFPSLTAASQDAVFRGLASNTDFFQKGFKLAKGAVSDPILASPSVLVLRVDDVKTAPTAEDTPVSTASVTSSASSDRDSGLRDLLLKGPLFKDEFQAEFNKLFTAP